MAAEEPTTEPGVGKQKATVDGKFRARLEALRADAGKQADAVRGEGARPWQVPAGSQLLNIATLHEPALNRDDVNSAYQQCMQDTDNLGTVADVVALKLQIDYMATEERALRLRHATVCRCLVHAGIRRQGLANSRTFPNIEKQVSDIIASGGA